MGPTTVLEQRQLEQWLGLPLNVFFLGFRIFLSMQRQGDLLQGHLCAGMSIFRFLLEHRLIFFDMVELGGIEPPSASDSPSVIRPFPRSGFTVATLPGQDRSRRPIPPVLSPVSAVFHAVSGLSLLSTTTSVARL